MTDEGILGYAISGLAGSGICAALIRGYAIQRVHATKLDSLKIREAECTSDRRELNVAVASIVAGVTAIKEKQDEMSADIKTILENGRSKE